MDQIFDLQCFDNYCGYTARLKQWRNEFYYILICRNSAWHTGAQIGRFFSTDLSSAGWHSGGQDWLIIW